MGASIFEAPMPEVPQEATSGQCTICLERDANVVAVVCGHLICCVSCRRRLVHEARVLAGSSDDTPVARRSLSTKELIRTKVCCPICRAESVLGEIGKYDGQVFVPSEHPEVEAQDEKEAAVVEPIPQAAAHSASASSRGYPAKQKQEDPVPEAEALTEEEKAVLKEEQKQDVLKRQREKALLALRVKVRQIKATATSTLMNDEGMDSFLGYMVYTMMRAETFAPDLYLAGKTNTKNMTARRKLKIKMRLMCNTGARLDRKASHTGDVTYTVQKLEETETKFAVIVRKHLEDLDDIMKSVSEVDAKYSDKAERFQAVDDRLCIVDEGCAADAAEVRQLLQGYLYRHDQRNKDLLHMITNGSASAGVTKTLQDKSFRMHFATGCGPTTYLLDGTQMTDLQNASKESCNYLLTRSTGLVRRGEYDADAPDDNQLASGSFIPALQDLRSSILGRPSSYLEDAQRKNRQGMLMPDQQPTQAMLQEVAFVQDHLKSAGLDPK